jgi:hypothetical protein
MGKVVVESRTFEVLVSFSGLNVGERFTLNAGDPWAAQHMGTGYLRDVTEEVPDAGRGEVDQG